MTQIEYTYRTSLSGQKPDISNGLEQLISGITLISNPLPQSQTPPHYNLPVNT